MLQKLFRLVGTLLLWSDIALVGTLGGGLILLASGREQLLERAVPVLFALFVMGIAGRIVAGAHVLIAADLAPGERLDTFMRTVFVTGFAASRYLRTLEDDGGSNE